MTRILIADDAPIMRRILREIVAPEAFEVAGEARDGSQAVRLFERLRPDVVLLDLVMPGVDGIQALRLIRSIDPTARVVVSCALGQEPLAAEALWWGAVETVVKPFRPEEVVATLERVAAKPIELAS